MAAKTVFASGRSIKLEAWEAGGADYISLNLYVLSDGEVRLFPCEMPRAKVIDFVETLEVVGPPATGAAGDP